MISICEVLKVSEFQTFQDKKPKFKKSLTQMIAKKINLKREKEKHDKELKQQILGQQPS